MLPGGTSTNLHDDLRQWHLFPGLDMYCTVQIDPAQPLTRAGEELNYLIVQVDRS